MLERVEHDNDVVTFRSPLLAATGVPHGFSTRVGGLSDPPFDTLNLGSLAKGPTGDANTSVAENFRRLRRALGLTRHMRFEAKQVHGCGVYVAEGRPRRPADAPEADAVIVDGPGRLALVRVADCVPVLLATRDGVRVAAVHAGWRGVVAGVVPEAVGRLAPADQIIAAIGPCISAEHFEVGDEVASAFRDAGLSAAVIRGSTPRPHVDLRLAVHQQLAAAGVSPDAIDSTDVCTYRDRDLFFSHRRDVTHEAQPATGRMAAVVAPATRG